MSQSRKFIWLLRHGERYDCTDPKWKATAKRPHDPHLSRAGLAQGYAAGRLIHQHALEHCGVEHLADIAIYTSPFLRCVQTAKSISTGYYDQLVGKQVSSTLPPLLSNNANAETSLTCPSLCALSMGFRWE